MGALRLAREKAEAVAAQYPQSYVLGADTIVVLRGEVLGKPQDHADAARMLRLLSGRAHEVTTAVSLTAPSTSVVAPGTLAETRASTTKVYFREIAEAEIQQYVAGGEPMDKPGRIRHTRRRFTLDRPHRGGIFQCGGIASALVTEM